MVEVARLQRRRDESGHQSEVLGLPHHVDRHADRVRRGSRRRRAAARLPSAVVGDPLVVEPREARGKFRLLDARVRTVPGSGRAPSCRCGRGRRRPSTPAADRQLMSGAELNPCSDGQPAPGPWSSGYLRPSMIRPGLAVGAGRDRSGQRCIASIASAGLSATCPSASMIRMMTPMRSSAAAGNPNRVDDRRERDRRHWTNTAQIAGKVPLITGRARARLLGMVVAIARPKLEGKIAVGDDRQLGFAEFGDPQGRAVFWLHGTPGARRQIPTEARVFAEDHHIRLIGIDRPGIGSSTPFQYDTVVAFADDLRTVADTLGVDKMAVVGLSGGGPYTLGCAAAMPDRVVAVGVLGGVAPTRGADAIGGRGAGSRTLRRTAAGARRVADPAGRRRVHLDDPAVR